MYVIHDSLVGEETVTFAYIRARVVTRMCFPASFVEYLWILSHFPLRCTCLSLTWCLALSHSNCRRAHARGTLPLLSKHRVPGWLSDCSLSLSCSHAHAATASAVWKDRWRQKAAPLHRCGLRSTSGQAAAAATKDACRYIRGF